MSMSKRDFIALADVIRAFNKSGRRPFSEGELSALADWCQATNPRFNRPWWFGYIRGICGPNGGERKEVTGEVNQCD